jgi:hypothetical protein
MQCKKEILFLSEERIEFLSNTEMLDVFKMMVEGTNSLTTKIENKN